MNNSLVVIYKLFWYHFESKVLTNLCYSFIFCFFPILDALFFIFWTNQRAKHYNHSAFIFPYHLPEFNKTFLNWALSSNQAFHTPTFNKPINIVCINICFYFLSVFIFVTLLGIFCSNIFQYLAKLLWLVRIEQSIVVRIDVWSIFHFFRNLLFYI